MSSNEIIERLIVEASSDPLNPVYNFNIAIEYENLNQTASAVSFYLRAAEYGYQTHPLITYASLLRVSLCIEDQKDRNLSVTNVLLQAIGFLPARPEAYFLMSRFHEKSGNWQECYAYAQSGLVFANQEMQSLPCGVYYDGEIDFIFEKSVSAWWIGRQEESFKLTNMLNDNPNIPEYYKEAIARNLKAFNS